MHREAREKRVASLFPVVCSVISAAFLCPILIPSILAGGSSSAESVGSSTFSVEVKDVISVRVLDGTATSQIAELNVNIAPTPQGSTVTQNAIVDVATSNRTGYTLYMASDYQDNNNNYTTALINVDPTVDATIPTSTSAVSNFWNYTVGASSPIAIPAHGAPDTIRDDVSEPTESSLTTVGISVNVDNDTPSGTYRNKLMFTATANYVPPELPDFWNITTMQEMTPEVCASVYTPNNTVSVTDENIITKARALAREYTANSDGTSSQVPETTLLDDRDADGTGTKKSYKVRKLADGNCWMVENLEYDLVGLYNNGKRGIGSKNDGSTFEMTDANLASGVTYYDVTTENAYDVVISQNTRSLDNVTRLSSLGDVAGQTEYYYNWTAATAGQGSKGNSVINANVDGSICPAGWRLPTNYDDIDSRNISWSALTDAYLGSVNTTTGVATMEKYPLNFYRAGNITANVHSDTAYGLYVSSMASSSNNRRYLLLAGDYVYPQFTSSKAFGYQVRCVANPAPQRKTFDFWRITTMQEMTPEICASVYTPNNTVSMTDEYIVTKAKYENGEYTATGDGTSPQVPEITLLDDRDADGTGTKKSYKVRKLADGNCWMVENLAYDIVGLYNNGKRGIGSRNDGTTFEMTDANLANGVGYYTSTDDFNYVINSYTRSENATRSSYLGDTTGIEYYYNWTTATAGQGSQNDSTRGTTIDGSICPAGWRIPTNYSNTSNQRISYSALTLAYMGGIGDFTTDTGYQIIEQYPINLYRVSNIYWEATTSSADGGYIMYYTTSAVGPRAYSMTKRYGYQVRCVATR